ncbi:integrase core domain [Plakobranchus ocellatus]|uniref:Integrase core domain n=1 Tax=Plakobranchus ocellatus TaxID=259542 RepID=A0AAV4BCC6_9GAST|nr:integrase core domain [Plakobranchus ocellatus]
MKAILVSPNAVLWHLSLYGGLADWWHGQEFLCFVCANPTKLFLPFPEHPWSRLTIDIIFYLHDKIYLSPVDHHFWREIGLLDCLTSAAVIVWLKSFLPPHGMPDILISYNRPQFACAEFTKSMELFQLTHMTDSSRNPQVNGEDEPGE